MAANLSSGHHCHPAEVGPKQKRNLHMGLSSVRTRVIRVYVPSHIIKLYIYVLHMSTEHSSPFGEPVASLSRSGLIFVVSPMIICLATTVDNDYSTVQCTTHLTNLQIISSQPSLTVLFNLLSKLLRSNM
jgi:hypothetical protein